MATPQMYKIKPIPVMAMQFTGSNNDRMDVLRWIEAQIGSCQVAEYEPDGTGVAIDPATGLMVIRTPEEDVKVNDGDWVIKNVWNNFVVLDPKFFAKTYEPVEQEPVQTQADGVVASVLLQGHTTSAPGDLR